MNKSQIQHRYRMLKELHGSQTLEVFVAKIAVDLGITKTEVLEALQIPGCIPDKKYALINMRAQPFHFGHEHIINEALIDGRIPIVVLGDDNGVNPEKNPLSYIERRTLIQLVFPNVEIVFVQAFDNSDWSKWFDQYTDIIAGKDVIFYYNNKEEDRYKEFTALGKVYQNEFYTKIFEDSGIPMKQIEFAGRTDIHIDAHATNIRESFEGFKHLLDGRVYWKLKEWGW